MNIGLFGYGKMGKIIEKIALERGHIIGEIREEGEEFIGNAEVYIDFTMPSSVIENISKALEKKIPMVIGTTGWLSNLSVVQKMAESANVPIIYGGNFSLGVNLFWRCLTKMAEEFSVFSAEYDVFTHEFHHRFKKDSPSGTALTTAEIILQHFHAKQKIYSETLLERAITPEELHTTATRGGSVPGTHSVYFDSAFDTIEFTHTARSREGFALGAVLASEKIQKLPGGLHHFPDIFEKLFMEH